jgi:hypothetical protein
MRLASMVKRASMRSGKRSCWRMAFFLPSWRMGVGERRIEARGILSLSPGCHEVERVRDK